LNDVTAADYFKRFHLQVLGLNTNIQFLTDLAKHPEFMKGNVHTDFIPQFSQDLFPEHVTSTTAVCQAAVAMVIQQSQKIEKEAKNTQGIVTVSF
jgi:3-methylcrotonyl-CoA carboxylase alpha subunit